MKILQEAIQKSRSEISCDTETNWTNNWNERYCLGIAIATDSEEFYVSVKHQTWMIKNEKNVQPPPDLISNLQVPVIFHNAKFDLQILKKAGVLPPQDFYDTMLMAHLIDENRLSFSLEELAQDLLGVGKDVKLQKLMKSVQWNDVPAFAMARYAERDARVTLDLYHALKPWFGDYEEVWNVDKQFLLVLQNLEEKGLLINRALAEELKERCETRLVELVGLIGFDPAKTKILQQKLFDEPPFGLGLRVRGSTPGGKPQVNDEFLEQTNHPICGLILEWRGLNKQLTAYYNPYLEQTKSNGRLHASYKQHGTVTGRLSCADPNLQQIPREGRVKKLFMPDPGYELWEVDYRNIEMRLAAVYSEEPLLLETFKEEGDVHQKTANELGISRQDAKTINFLIIYGGGETKLATQLGITQVKAAKYLRQYRDLYRNLFRTMYSAEQVVDDLHFIKMWSGRRRHFKWQSEHRKAFNSIIQGGSFEIVKRSMIKLEEAGFDQRCQVHDSVWLQVSSEDEVIKAQALMEDWTEPTFDLKFTTDRKRLN
jgi:DNA polymerase-1